MQAWSVLMVVVQADIIIAVDGSGGKKEAPSTPEPFVAPSVPVSKVRINQ